MNANHVEPFPLASDCTDNYSSHFKLSGDWQIQGWPDLSVRHRPPNSQWRKCDPRCLDWLILELANITLDHQLDHLEVVEAQLLLPFPEQSEESCCKSALKSLAKAIPHNAINRAARFTRGGWQLLRMQALVPRFEELIDSNPALAWMLASHNLFTTLEASECPSAAVREWCCRRQREILGLLGFPTSDTCRKIIAKISPDSIDAPLMLLLRDSMLQQECAKRIRHLPKINAEALSVAVDTELLRITTPNFLLEVSENAFPEKIKNIRKILRSVLTLSREYHLTLPRAFQTIAQLIDFASDMGLDLNCDSQFPSAPWPGTQEIIPLISPELLCAEGLEMGHCAGFRAADVGAGNCYVYKVLAPERATLSLVLEDGRWVVGEWAGPRNSQLLESSVIQILKIIESEGFARPTKRSYPYLDCPVWLLRIHFGLEKYSGQYICLEHNFMLNQVTDERVQLSAGEQAAFEEVYESLMY